MSGHIRDDIIIGTCETLCPPSEIDLRQRNKLVHFFESKYNVYVKEFSRSAADKNFTKPESLRTFDAMIKTLDFLFIRILFDTSKPLNYRYDFCFDRCRALRQEIVIQNFSAEKTLKVLEPIAMFLSLSLYKMQNLEISLFDSTICKQHLNECLLKCLSCYDEIDDALYTEKKILYNQENRIIVEGTHLMLNMTDEGTLRRALKLNLQIRNTITIRTSLNIAINMHIHNYCRVIRLISNLPHITCAIASLKLKDIRKEILRNFSIAYNNNNNLRVPTEFIKHLLAYNCNEHVKIDLVNLGILNETESSSTTSVYFDRKKFDISKSCSRFSSDFVESKLEDCHLPDLILFRNIY